MNSDSAALYGGSLVTVVEYLESSMSRDLLGKFPDNSSFDFDYSQSSIWSPLIHRSHPTTKTTTPSKNLRADRNGLRRIKDMTASIKRKFSYAVLDNLQKYRSLKKRKMKKSRDFSPVAYADTFNSTSPTPRKGWAKVLKAASKRFKKMKTKNDSIARMNLTRCLTEGGDS